MQRATGTKHTQTCARRFRKLCKRFLHCHKRSHKAPTNTHRCGVFGQLSRTFARFVEWALFVCVCVCRCVRVADVAIKCEQILIMSSARMGVADDNVSTRTKTTASPWPGKKTVVAHFAYGEVSRPYSGGPEVIELVRFDYNMCVFK